MHVLEMRTDDPEDMSDQLAEGDVGDRVIVRVPVTVSAQDSRFVAESIRGGIFVAECLAVGLGEPRVSTEDDDSDPNGEAIRLEGVVKDVSLLRSFVKEWFDTLDPDGSLEPFELSSEEAVALYERLDSDEPKTSFRFPSLVDWYRDARSQFASWNEDEDADE